MTSGFARASLAVLLLAGATPASAQMLFNSIGSGGKPPAPAPKVAPPPALPGAASSANAAAPAARAPTDMEPNDALFDAINRGDVAAARDAISRGADLGARNILGMTPMELSVDLGRNDISFLLLSMRDNGSKAASKAAPVTAAKQPTGKAAKAAPVAKVATVTQRVPSQTPRLFSGDGGAPNPNAGFLGFDTARR
jgi:hypothetical protein